MSHLSSSRWYDFREDNMKLLSFLQVLTTNPVVTPTTLWNRYYWGISEPSCEFQVESRMSPLGQILFLTPLIIHLFIWLVSHPHGHERNIGQALILILFAFASCRGQKIILDFTTFLEIIVYYGTHICKSITIIWWGKYKMRIHIRSLKNGWLKDYFFFGGRELVTHTPELNLKEHVGAIKVGEGKISGFQEVADHRQQHRWADEAS